MPVALTALLCVALWGVTYPLLKLVMLQGVPPIFLIFLRMAICALVFAPWIRPPRQEWGRLLILSALLYFIPLSFTAIGTRHVDAAIASLTAQLDVPFAIALAVIFLREPVTSLQAAGFVVSFAGIYLIHRSPEITDQNLWALGCLIFASFSYAASTLVLKGIRMRASQMTVWSHVVAVPFTLGGSMAFEGTSLATLAAMTPGVWGLTILLALSSMGAFFLWSGLLQRHRVSRIVPFTMLIPVTGTAASYLLLAEHTHILALLGGAITVFGVALQLRDHKDSDNGASSPSDPRPRSPGSGASRP